MTESTQPQPLSAELAAFNAAIALANVLLPRILEACRKGEISLEAQQAARNNYEALRAAGAQAFTGQEWEVTASSSSSSPSSSSSFPIHGNN